MNKGNPQGYKAFTAVAYAIPKADSPEEVSKLFSVLAGEAEIDALTEVGGLSKTLEKFHHIPKAWKAAKHWVNWWRRPKHLRMLAARCSKMDSGVFNSLPNSTNAVESHNRCSKGTAPDILKVALLSTYKQDMAASLEHLANSQGIKTSYADLTPAARAKQSAVANKARSRKRARYENEETDGPLDKHKDFKKAKTATKGKQGRTVETPSTPNRSSTDDLISISDSPCSPTVYWIDSLKLFPSDQQRLLEGGELNARLLMAAATIYRTQFPELPSFQDPGYALNLKKLRPATEGSMYFHNHDGHWTLSKLADGRISHYDSLQAKYISSTLGEQLAALYGHLAEASELTVRQQQVQVQRGGKDCGLFTVAFAMSVLLGDEPCMLQYDQKQMRGHLAHCLENQLMTPFPAVVKRTRRQPQPLLLKLKL